MMSVKELREKGIEALLNELSALEEKLVHLRMQHSNGQLLQTHILGNTKRDIARVKTFITEKTMNILVAE